MKKLLAAICVASAVVVGASGCGSGPSVEIPDQPVPPPTVAPMKAGSSLPPTGPDHQQNPG
jgi:hypothetical protein